ncbi:TPA: hypothetical protein ACTYTC_003585 [Klebsiella pneumoniae]|uniref:hypothetical protein n=1 Tax=Klebsiella pneumoniae TaxID=573 RepID=UPI000E2D82C2|nr:hypothetical protein [Klebsiella pneumoniae]MDR7686061.1 hypothetical protein [Klebsiella pneumoniae]CAE6227397.1 hypothetical protein AI2651V1_1248 [Klebsiella pneumoniae]CAE6280558.1 hypothetical protein AI2651V1_3751 [Klebsiella pneumoniae]CAH3400327.1 hypothetical protein AI2651V1_1248 [Klebsiella pneumoniae]CAH3646145.1 hypothetical protein AI2651V1_3751 [Klebsiella pneumoniae]
MKNEVEQIAQQNDMSIEFVTWFFNEKKANCGNVWFMMMAAMWEGWKGRSIEIDKLATENVVLKLAIPEPRNVEFDNDSMDDVSLDEDVGFNDAIGQMKINISKTTATARIVAGIKADGVVQAANECYGTGHICETLLAYAPQLREGADK